MDSAAQKVLERFRGLVVNRECDRLMKKAKYNHGRLAVDHTGLSAQMVKAIKAELRTRGVRLKGRGKLFFFYIP